MSRPAVRFHSAEEVAAALSLTGPGGVTLLSAPGAAAWPGARVVAAMVARGAAGWPGVPHEAVLDCGSAPGLALDAIRQGWRRVILDPALPAFDQVAAAGATVGAVVLGQVPVALELRRIDLRRPGGKALLARWLAGKGVSLA
ncbi:hypothetical protein [Muricoccus radiodurans]|uniref:hypothetical protein n=1 Tax=Muricoccus radiodurans TaxID=2231721 RepID=UPI003CE7ED7B